MESYEDFIRTQLSRLDGKGSEQKRESACHGSSVIRFHGLPILPPLLTAVRRAEMLTYRTDALELVDRRNKSALGRRMLHLSELLDSVQLRKAPTLREFMGGQSLAGGTEGGASEEAEPEEAESLLSCPPHVSDEEPCPQRGCEPPRPLSSTARGSLASGGLRLAAEMCGDVSHQSASSGYATHDNTEVSAGHTEVTEGNAEVTEGHTEVTESHAEVTECHAEVTESHTEVAAGDMAGRLLDVGAGEGEGEREGGRKGGGEDEGAGRTETAPESFFLHCTGEAEPELAAGPPRVSLQSLLKRSQEYRQRQRLLRGARTHCRSDKENQPGRTPLRRARGDRRPCPVGTARPARAAAARPNGLEPGGVALGSGERGTSREEGGDTGVSRCELPAADGLQGRGGPAEPPRAESPPPAPEAPPPAPEAPPPDLEASPPAPEAPPPGPPGLQPHRFGTVPSPQFCTSPVHCKRTGRPARKLPVNTAVTASGGHRGRQSADAEGRPAGGGAELAQLEMNLSSLKALISDLQATLTGTPEEETRPADSASQNAERSERTQPRPVPSLAQRRRVPHAFRNVPGAGLRQGPVLSDASNQAPARGGSGNRSYDVETPSALWPPGGGRGPGSAPGGKPLTPEAGGLGQDSRAKRRLLMNTGTRGEPRPLSSTPKGWISVLGNQQLQLQQTHAAQLQALVENQQLQLQELLQRLSLQGVSVLVPSPGSGVKGVVTCFPLEPRPLEQRSEPRPLLQPPCSSGTLPSVWRPLVAAAVRGYLTRRLLRTERLAQLRRTVKDSQQFLWALQAQTPGRGDLGGRQDLLLQERVLLQLRSARYEIHDIFFCFSPTERVQLISWDRQLLRERELKGKESGRTQSRGRASLSAATMKALERKRSAGCQKRAAERQRGSVGGVCGTQGRRHPHSERRSTLSGGNPKTLPNRTRPA
ncbi:uncharacterized protein cp110 [Anguilla rostrata]|uniref:uncharacterized protein cp110 n=1 Tax=Anguilla rostrata TaxID=7938 RepID=UPI0030CF6A2E